MCSFIIYILFFWISVNNGVTAFRSKNWLPCISMIINHLPICIILKRNLLYWYHFQRVRTLILNDYTRSVEYCKWFFKSGLEFPSFVQKLYLPFIYHNNRTWENINRHAICQSVHQQIYFITVFFRIYDSNLIGPRAFPKRLNGELYPNFLQNELSEFLKIFLYLNHFYKCSMILEYFCKSVTNFWKEKFVEE